MNNTIIITPAEPEKAGGIPRASQRTQTLRGTVRDRDSRFPLPFASVILLDTDPQRGVTTDLQGNSQVTMDISRRRIDGNCLF